MNLSKSRFVSGLQCHVRLWREVHEPGAPELVPDVTRDVQLQRSRMVAEAARMHLGEGAVVTSENVQQHAATTTAALLTQHPRLYDAELRHEALSARADVLEQTPSGTMLTEVKASTKLKPEHLPDVAFQVNAARKMGLDLRCANVMHLNRECRFPDLSNLFQRTDVTRDVEPFVERVRLEAQAQLSMLEGPLPQRADGVDCGNPYPCPFQGRCNAPTPNDHVETLYRLGGKKLAQLLAMGCERIADVPGTFPLGDIAARQRRAVKAGGFIVEGHLAAALRSFEAPVALLDFETVSPAIPLWPDCRPYDAIPVQMSCHIQRPASIDHHEWLAEGPEDPRRPAARAVVDACSDARTILAYNASFERAAIERLKEGAPELESDLSHVIDRLHDLLPVVRDHVYHVDFRGSFSIKSVLPVLVPGEGYEDLTIADGLTASATLERLLYLPNDLADSARMQQREDLLRYCERDTFGMVRLLERLRQLA